MKPDLGGFESETLVTIYSFVLQALKHSLVPGLVVGVAQSCWTMCPAEAMRQDLSRVLIALLASTTVGIMKTQESDVRSQQLLS